MVVGPAVPVHSGGQHPGLTVEAAVDAAVVVPTADANRPTTEIPMMAVVDAAGLATVVGTAEEPSSDQQPVVAGEVEDAQKSQLAEQLDEKALTGITAAPRVDGMEKMQKNGAEVAQRGEVEVFEKSARGLPSEVGQGQGEVVKATSPRVQVKFNFLPF